jgi:hypothetical protein
MSSPHPRHLRRVIDRALRPSGQELSPMGVAVRRLALQLQRQAERRLPHTELVNQIVSWIAQRRAAPGVAAGQWPTAVLHDTRRDLTPGSSA